MLGNLVEMSGQGIRRVRRRNMKPTGRSVAGYATDSRHPCQVARPSREGDRRVAAHSPEPPLTALNFRTAPLYHAYR
jgi:hypothetical protein